MKSITNLSKKRKSKLFLEMHEIANYNKKWFFSDGFFNLINNELKENITRAFKFLDNPKYQTAKEPTKVYRAYRRYRKYLSGDAKEEADNCVSQYPERIDLSKKNIGKY